MRLIHILSSQIGGEMKYFNDEGAVVEIQFKPVQKIMTRTNKNINWGG